ncbi:MAG: hypothetical protein EX271_10135 [Acidimicrobiales bacterium]|nr:hypothetical protein [Hyphomonadaceae bacterium]RZV40312.1 MAG: hypothetical protein EX271_10135 [Acidimicrobiales bacterium]
MIKDTKNKDRRKFLPCRAVFLDRVDGRTSLRRGKYPERAQKRTLNSAAKLGLDYQPGPILWFEDDEAADAVLSRTLYIISKAGIEIEREHHIPYVRNSLTVLERTLRHAAHVSGCKIIPREEAATWRGFVNARAVRG